jgi:F-type H+-transporting ATPase subunit delta
MSARSVARRYAGALFDVARRSGAEERAGRELTELAGIVSGHAELAHVLDSPVVAPSVKRGIMEAILDASGDVLGETRRLVSLVAENGRVGLLPELAGAYADRLRAERRVVPAEVVTAAPIAPERRAALAAALARATGQDVALTERVDPAIVAGLVARVGSVVFDGSVTRQLERLQQRLRAGT